MKKLSDPENLPISDAMVKKEAQSAKRMEGFLYAIGTFTSIGALLGVLESIAEEGIHTAEYLSVLAIIISIIELNTAVTMSKDRRNH